MTRSALLASLALAGLAAVASAQSPQTATVSTPAASAVFFEDRFASPDANTPGPRWREYTLRRNIVRAEESPWRINNSLSFEALGTGDYIEDLVETVDTFPIDNVRVEFEFRGAAGTAKGYVGPTVWWSADARNLFGAGNVSTGPPLIGVQATYRWENRGTRGVTINVGGVMKDHPDAIFAGLNEPKFARHVLTIANGRVTYESAGFPAVTYPLASPPRPGERRHLAFGARIRRGGRAGGSTRSATCCPVNVSDRVLLACPQCKPATPEIEPNPCAGFTLADFKNGNRSLAFMKCALKCGGPVSNPDGTPGGPPKSDAAIQACMAGRP